MFNKLGHCTKFQLNSILIGFYTECEPEATKDQLFADLVNLNLYERPLNVKHCKAQ